MSEIAHGRRYSLRRVDGWPIYPDSSGSAGYGSPSFAILDMDDCWREVYLDFPARWKPKRGREERARAELARLEKLERAEARV